MSREEKVQAFLDKLAGAQNVAAANFYDDVRAEGDAEGYKRGKEEGSGGAVDSTPYSEEQYQAANKRATDAEAMLADARKSSEELQTKLDAALADDADDAATKEALEAAKDHGSKVDNVMAQVEALLQSIKQPQANPSPVSSPAPGSQTGI